MPKIARSTDSMTTHWPISVVLRVQSETDSEQPQASVKQSTK